MKMTLRQLGALARLSILELYRRKDLLVVCILAMVLLLPLTLFTPFGIHGASRYVNEITMLLIWIFSIFIGLGVAARLFPPEFENRTIYPLLARPVKRPTVLLGKYLGALAAAISALLVFYLAYALFTGFRQGSWFPAILLQAILLHIGFIVVITAMALLGSLFLSPAANLTLCVLIIATMLLFGVRLPTLAATQPPPGNWLVLALHWVAPHLEFFDLRQRLIHEWEPLSAGVTLLVLLYACGYAAICLGLAALVFKRKRF